MDIKQMFSFRNSVPLPTVISSENGIYHINSRGNKATPDAFCLAINRCTEGLHE